MTLINPGLVHCSLDLLVLLIISPSIAAIINNDKSVTKKVLQWLTLVPALFSLRLVTNVLSKDSFLIVKYWIVNAENKYNYFVSSHYLLYLYAKL